MRIIDIHTHPVFFHEGARPEELAELVRHARGLGVEHMISLGDVLVYGAQPNAEQLRAINDQSAAAAKRFPEFFTAFVYLNPLLGEKATMAEAERCAALPGFRGIKLEMANNATHPCMRHIAKAARTFDLVVLQHSWSMVNIKDRKRQSDPADTARFARRYPDLKIIMAHLTGIGFRGVLEAKGLPNLFVDTSGGLPEEGLVEFAVEQLGADRLLYGSDHPVRDMTSTIGRVLGARLSESEKRKVFFENSLGLLQLPHLPAASVR
jgi:predicted TIM-barrel fold metal-dependent hydrolase